MEKSFLGRLLHRQDNGAGASGGKFGTAADVSAPELPTATVDVKPEGAVDSSMEPKSPPTDLEMKTPEAPVADEPKLEAAGSIIQSAPAAVKREVPGAAMEPLREADETETLGPAAMKPAEMRDTTAGVQEIAEPTVEPDVSADRDSGRDKLLVDVRRKTAEGNSILPEGSMPDMDSEPPIEEDVHSEAPEEPEIAEGEKEAVERLTPQRVIEVVAEVLEQPVDAVSEASTMEDLMLWTDAEPGGAIDVDSFDQIKEQLGVENLSFNITATATVANLIEAISTQMPDKIQ